MAQQQANDRADGGPAIDTATDTESSKKADNRLPGSFDAADFDGRKPQEYYDEIKAKFAEERDLRLGYRPPGTELYIPMEGDLARYETDPYADEVVDRDPIIDTAQGHGGRAVHRRWLLSPADLSPAPPEGRGEHPHRGAGGRRRRDVVLEPLPRRRL